MRVNSAAGRRRRARRSQNAPRATRSLRATSLIISIVIRNPERVKNIEMLKKAPGRIVYPPWYSRTATSPMPRMPSKAPT